jgi:hypothetical protein
MADFSKIISPMPRPSVISRVEVQIRIGRFRAKLFLGRLNNLQNPLFAFVPALLTSFRNRPCEFWQLKLPAFGKDAINPELILLKKISYLDPGTSQG